MCGMRVAWLYYTLGPATRDKTKYDPSVNSWRGYQLFGMGCLRITLKRRFRTRYLNIAEIHSFTSCEHAADQGKLCLLDSRKRPFGCMAGGNRSSFEIVISWRACGTWVCGQNEQEWTQIQKLKNNVKHYFSRRASSQKWQITSSFPKTCGRSETTILNVFHALFVFTGRLDGAPLRSLESQPWRTELAFKGTSFARSSARGHFLRRQGAWTSCGK